MNKIERKLYNLICEDKSALKKALSGTVKNSETGNDVKVSSALAYKDSDNPGQKAAYQAAVGALKTAGASEKQINQIASKGKEKSAEKEPKKPETPAAGQQPAKAEPVKIAATDFKTDAEKEKDGETAQSNGNKTAKKVGADDTTLKSLMPGVDTSVKTLDQNPMARQQLSLKMDELSKLVDAASSKDEKNSIDACQVTIPGTNLYCDDNLGIPRVEMPQFKGPAVPGSDADKMSKNEDGEVNVEEFFQKFLKDKGIKVNNGEDGKGVEVPPDRMKATQRDMQAAKILGMKKGLEEDPENPNLTAPIMVSSDGYILDGHHRWAAMVAYNAENPDRAIPLKATIIDKPMKDLVPMANQFADGIGIAKKSVGPAKPKEPQKPVAENKRIKLSSFFK